MAQESRLVIVIDSQKAIENTIDNVNVRTVVWNKLYHRSVLENLSFRVGKLNEDEFFTFYALSNAQHIVYLFRQLYFYYQRPNSIMGTYSLKRLDMLDGVKERMEFVEKKYPEIYTKAKLSFCQCCIYQRRLSESARWRGFLSRSEFRDQQERRGINRTFIRASNE